MGDLITKIIKFSQAILSKTSALNKNIPQIFIPNITVDIKV